MPKIKNESKAYIVGNVLILQKDEKIRSLCGSPIKVISNKNKFCLCDIGGEKPIFIPVKNLKTA